MTALLDGFAFGAIVLFLVSLGLIASAVILTWLFEFGAWLFGFGGPPR